MILNWRIVLWVVLLALTPSATAMFSDTVLLEAELLEATLLETKSSANIIPAGESVTTHSINADFLASHIEKIKSLSGLPSGTSIAVVSGDEIIYSGQFGYADIQSKSAVNAQTPFYIASATKPFVALLALLDDHQGRLSVNTQVSDMYPSLQKASIGQFEPSIKHLLTHMSGIENLPLVLATAYSGEHSHSTLEKIINEYSTGRDDSSAFKYSNVGYNLWSVYTDRVFQQPWSQRLRKTLLDPLKLNHTAASRDYFNEKNLMIAKPYSLMSEAPTSPLYLEKQENTLHAAGGMFASSNDMATWLIHQINLGEIKGHRVLPASLIKDSQQPQASTQQEYGDFTREGYAWGWWTGHYKGEPLLHHFGGFAGTHAHLSFMPQRQLGLVVLNNEDMLSSKLTQIIADYVYGALLGQSDIESKTKLRFEQLQRRLEGIAQVREKRANTINNRKLVLSLPKAHYVGSYHHPLMGTLKVQDGKDNQLAMTWGNLRSNVQGFDTVDKVRVSFDPSSGEVIQFDVEPNLGVCSATYNGIVFSRTQQPFCPALAATNIINH